jgi:pyruvate formate lyase activating enzyme
VGACHYGALVRYGEEMDADEIFDRVKRDRIFYDASGGGVTVSGGEPLIHAEVVRRVFDLCKREGIDTCAETGGYVPKEAIDAVAPVTDRFCFDLKLIRSDRHREYTGAPNEGILENARRLVAAGADVLFRMPLVPGVNDGEENTAGTADFLKSLGLAKPRLELMPFHRMGQTKYEALDLRYAFGETASSDTAEIDRIQSVYRDLGVMCTVSR